MVSTTQYGTWLRASMGRRGSIVNLGASGQEPNVNWTNQRSQMVNNGNTSAEHSGASILPENVEQDDIVSKNSGEDVTAAVQGNLKILETVAKKWGENFGIRRYGSDRLLLGKLQKEWEILITGLMGLVMIVRSKKVGLYRG